MLMRLLQMPITTLEQQLKEEIEKNPLLEILPESNGDEEVPPVDPIPEEDFASEETDDDDYNYRERQERDKNQDRRESILVSEGSFSDYLIDQLSMRQLTPRQKAIATEIVGSIDDAGYVSRSIELISNDLAFTQGLDVAPQEVLEVLRIVQQLDPPGIAARNLQECLSLQLHRDVVDDEPRQHAMLIVDKHFELFANHNYSRLQQQLGLTDEQLQAASERILRLTPKPGAGASLTSHAQYVIPDFVVTRRNDELHLTLNDSHLPQLQTSRYYQEMLDQLMALRTPSRQQLETIDFIRSKTDSANDLVGSLKQRHVTMLRVMKAIMQRQHQFFLTGDSADLRPLLQKDIAEATGFDISTISRVVNSKYVQADFGTIPLKDCFSQSIQGDAGEEIATERIRQALQEVVDKEDKSAPLSDDALAQQLADQGYPVARRTVAKYREQLGIPVSRLRRQLKMVAALLCLMGSVTLFAQQPSNESYYDSLIRARIREGQRQPGTAANGKKGDNSKTPKKGGSLELHEPEPDPTAVDTALASGDELIDVMYNATLPPPSALWYGSDLSGSYVRLRNVPMDSLPDEITIRLIKDKEKFCFPVKNIITSPYGWRWNRPHRGVDIRLKMGEPVHCAFNGVVRIARPMGAYGNLVVVRHYNGLETVYGHLSKINVKPMQIVAAGQVLGLGGSTGRSTGPHLHFEVRFQYEAFDPEWILDFSNYTLRTRKLYLDKTYFGIRKPRVGEASAYKADKSIVPEEQPKAKSDKPVYATVKKGDTLEDIAKRNYTTVEKLKQLNPGLTKPKVGTKIRVR